jgi:hypothetical protein
MKSRPRSVEREVAASLTRHFLNMDMSPVERIPVLGRTGPDLTINESKWAVDVKSRLHVPLANYRFRCGKIYTDVYHFLYIKLKDFPLIYSDDLPMSELLFPSVQVKEWLDHMAEWSRDDDRGNSNPAIVLHRPGTWVDNAVFVFNAVDRDKAKEIYQTWHEELLLKQQP